VTKSNKLNLLGVYVSALDLPTATAEMEAAIAAGRLSYASACPVYTLMQGHERAEVRAALNGADWVTPDGMPVVWALRLFGARGAGRVYGPDLMLALTELSARKRYAQYYFGGGPGVAEALAETLQRRFAGLKIAGVYCPPFRDLTPDEEQAMLEHINASGAQVVWVGLGSPKQDLWMARYRPRLKPPLLVGVGAAFDFFTGRQAQAPHWLQRSGLEWLFRLAHEPRRLWRRYLIYNPRFLFQLALQRLGLRRYET
jgi:N-acetylglucosaminyldiphosphoundecaprenol N-acetyl-beta-D-mannosaminyltransferase